MNKKERARKPRWWVLGTLACAMPVIAQQGTDGGASQRQRPAPAATAQAAAGSPGSQALQPCSGVAVEPPASVSLGKSSLVRLNVPVVRMVVGGTPSGRSTAPNAGSVSGSTGQAGSEGLVHPNLNDGVAQVDITLLSPTELFILGRKPGSMNLVLQAADGRCFIRDVLVTVDPDNLQARLMDLMPGETGIRVRAMDGALVLTGQVSDALKLDQVMNLAASLGENRRVVNMMRVAAPQQVMVEVKIAEVSKTLLDRFGIDFARVVSSPGSATVFSGIFGGATGVLGRLSGSLDFRGTGSAAISGALGAVGGTAATPPAPVDLATGAVIPRGGRSTSLGVDAQSRDGLIRVLAEPNIMAISGQAASFLSGGRIFIPVAQTREGGGSAITLEEKEFGIGLKFTPTVLDGARVNLKLTSEVSDLSQTGSPFTTVGGVTSVLPSVSTRRVDTTVQLGDGQSFAIAGLIKNNSTQSISRFPGLGDIPLLGALFRSTEFQKDQTELVFVVTPRLVKPLRTAIVLPTDVHVAPSRSDVWLDGKTEGRRDPAAPPPHRPAEAPLPRAATPPAGTAEASHPETPPQENRNDSP